MSLGIFTARQFRPGFLHAADITTKAKRWVVQRNSKRYFHSTPSTLNNPQEPHSRIIGNDNVKTWWRQNQSAIIQAINHDIQGDSPASKGNSEWKRHFIFANGTLEVSHEEEDPFIVAEGREEARFSVWLMSCFWKIHFSQIGEMEVVPKKDPHFTTLNNSETILARVSCQLFQQLHVFKQVDTTYKGWLYLYLRRPSQKPPSSDSEFQIPIKYSIWNYYKFGGTVVEVLQGVQRKAASLLSPKK